MEDAGIDAERAGARVGVFAGAALNTYVLHNVLPAVSAAGEADARAVALGADKDFLATRLAYELDLRGPALSVQTACSTSLVAVHLAVRSLRAGECDAALAGGVAIRVPQDEENVWQEGGIESPDGRCRAFDAAATGTVFGNGAGAVVLMRLSDALRAGHRIHALVRGTGIGNDGARKPGFAAPSIDGQRDAIRAALADAGVDPAAVSYVEGHGTGTPLGDSVELAALREALGDAGIACAVGSVKSNVGHLDTAAGVVGLVKAALALRERRLPPQPDFAAPADTPALRGRLEVLASARAWEANGPRFAGVSSFGIGGTNAHVVLEEPPAQPLAPQDAPRPRAIVLSAASAPALERLTGDVVAALRAPAPAAFADVAYTLAAGRRRFPFRRAVVAVDAADAAAALAGGDPRRTLDAVDGTRGRPVAFVFPGQGSQTPGMALALAAAEPAFAAALDRCRVVLAREHGFNLRAALARDAAPERLTDTAAAQPSLFAVEYALAELWRSWGVEPAALAGHSIGEYVAACIAGVFTLDDALGLVAARGRLMAAAPAGAMLAVAASEERVAPLLDGVEIAAFNGPEQLVAAGTVGAVRALETRLASAGIPCRALRTSHAFHCALVEPVLGEFARIVAGVPRRAPARAFVSNVTGRPISDHDATSAAYWVDHARRAVRFRETLDTLLVDPATAFLEVGPGAVLTALVRRAGAAGRVAVATLERPGAADEPAQARTALARLWVRGVDLDPAALGGGHHRLVAVPDIRSTPSGIGSNRTRRRRRRKRIAG